MDPGEVDADEDSEDIADDDDERYDDGTATTAGASYSTHMLPSSSPMR